MELPEDLTLLELVKFHGGFKAYLDNQRPMDVIAALNLENEADKLVRNFSSGMKQRLKLGLSVLTQSDMLLLDEPVTNLDDRGVKWYQELIATHRRNRLLIISSNRQEEYEMCEERVDVLGFK
jgi:ABC-type multidrug transport system ATPase subunit